MNFLRSAISKCNQLTPVLNHALFNKGLGASFSSLATPIHRMTPVSFLVPNTVTLLQACGLKVKGKIRRRCNDCYFVRREGRLYVMCHSFPRHKQTHLVRKAKYTWILTHAMTSRQRPY